MKTTINLNLLTQSVPMNELTIEQALDIAKIPQQYNEKRISAMISHVTENSELASLMTVQERYYFLINHQSISDNDYSHNMNIDRYLISVPAADSVPSSVQVGQASVSQLYGAHAGVLEVLCENVADWVMGKMACQLSGDLSFYVGGDADMTWEPLPPTLSEQALNEAIQLRFAQINALTTTQFNDLADGFNDGLAQLDHFLILDCDDDGITVIPQDEGGAEVVPARFLALAHLQGLAARLAERLAERRGGDDGTWQDELARSA